MSSLAINPNILVIKNEKIRNGVYVISNKKYSSGEHYRFAVDGLPNTFVHLVDINPQHLSSKGYNQTQKVLVVDDEDKFVEDLNRELVKVGNNDICAQIKNNELIFDERINADEEEGTIGDIIDSVTQRFNLRPSEISMAEYGNEYPPVYLCLSVMTEKGKSDTIDNETINEILKSTPLYKIGSGTTRKTVYVSHKIDDYTLTLFKMMSYRIRVTLRVNRKSQDTCERHTFKALNEVVRAAIKKS